MNKETGGPAFPNEGGAGHLWNDKGMTLRDYFAAKAMQAMCEEVSRYDQFEQCARNSYKLADAMLKERSK